MLELTPWVGLPRSQSGPVRPPDAPSFKDLDRSLAGGLLVCKPKAGSRETSEVPEWGFTALSGE